MRRALPTALAIAVLALPAVSGAASPRRLTPADRVQIGILVDRFVKEAVRRENLPAAWPLTGPGLRGGTSRSAWDAGTGVTVQFFPARGTSFRNAWTGQLVSPGHAVLALTLFPDAAHPKFVQVAMTVDVKKQGDRWVVDELYQAASFGKDGTVTGPRDFGAGAVAGGPAPGPARAGVGWLVGVSGAVGGLIVLVPLALYVRAKRREHRARRAYESALARRG